MSTKLVKRSLFALFWLGVLSAAVSCSSGADEPKPEEFSLTDVEWQWESVKDQATQETTTVPDPESYTFIFHDDGTFSGQADCNQIGGTYTQEAGLFIELGPSTLAFCGADSLDQQYLALLGSVVTGGDNGVGGLALETAAGGQRMTFRNGGAAPES